MLSHDMHEIAIASLQLTTANEPREHVGPAVKLFRFGLFRPSVLEIAEAERTRRRSLLVAWLGTQARPATHLPVRADRFLHRHPLGRMHVHHFTSFCVR